MTFSEQVADYYIAAGILDRIRELQSDELSQEEIVDCLNQEHFVSTQGNSLDQSMVSRILKRAGVRREPVA